MESQPQNPEFRIILKTFTHVIRSLPCFQKKDKSRFSKTRVLVNYFRNIDYDF